MQEEISQNGNETSDLNAPGAEGNQPKDSRVAQEGEVAGEAANQKPEAPKNPQDTYHVVCQEEMDRIAGYAKRVKMSPWSNDVLWLIDQLTRAVMILNDSERKAEVFKQALHKLTNGGFEKLQKEGPLWTEEEDKTLKPEEKDARMMDFLHKQVCCKCGKETRKKSEEAKP